MCARIIALIKKGNKSMNYDRLVNRILNENYTDFFDSFCEEFKEKVSELKEEIIDVGEIYYRARVGNDTFEGAIDDMDKLFDIPYFGADIDAPPARFVQGGRFNRTGISYLYLADNVETCIAEIHLQVGQICSIAQFECVKKGKYVLIEIQAGNNEIENLYNTLTKPVHSGIKDYYLVTQFFADVFRKMGYDGMIFPSTQGEGKNVVSFNKDYFSFVKYSEKMYIAKKICYEYEEVEDSYKKYPDYYRYLMSGNISEDEKRENKYNYIENKIEYEHSKKFEEAKKKFDISNNAEEFIKSMSNTPYIQKTCEYIGAFFLNKGEIEEGIKHFWKGLSSFRIANFHMVMKRVESCEWVKERDKYKEESAKLQIEQICSKYKEEHAKLQEEIIRITDELFCNSVDTKN